MAAAITRMHSNHGPAACCVSRRDSRVTRVGTGLVWSGRVGKDSPKERVVWFSAGAYLTPLLCAPLVSALVLAPPAFVLRRLLYGP